MRRFGYGLLTLLSLGLSGCTTELPEPESPAARLYGERCGGCHRVLNPASLTPEMWKIQVERMQGEMVRRGVAPLAPAEKELVLGYLLRHGAGAAAAAGE